MVRARVRSGTAAAVAAARGAAALLVSLAVAAAAASARPAGSADRAVAQPPAGRLAYRLAATYRAPEAMLRAGHYAHVADVAVRGDGVRLVLDLRQRALHAYSRDGRQPVAIWALPWLVDGGWTPLSVATGHGQEAVLLSVRDGDAGEESRFDRLDAAGRPATSWSGPVGAPYNDVAMAPGGAILSTRERPHPDASSRPDGGGMDVFAGGLLVERVEVDDLRAPVAVDVGPDGRVWVVDRGQGSPVPVNPPRPTGTPRPARDDTRPTAPNAFADAPDGVVELSPELVVVARHPFNAADDVAAGPAGVVVARDHEVFDLHDPARPLWSAPADVPNGSDTMIGGPSFALRLAAPGDRRLEVAVRHCRFQGLLRFPRAARPLGPAEMFGALAWPPLDGPRHPLAIAAGPGGLVLLMGRFQPLAGAMAPFGPPPSARIGTGSNGVRQVVQRWSADGQLQDQLGLCGDEDGWFAHRGDVRGVRSVALDGEVVVAGRADLLEGRHPSAAFGGWTSLPDAWRPALPAEPEAELPIVRIQAIDAVEGLGVALDGALGQLWWFDPGSGEPLGSADLAPFTDGGVLVDIALGAPTPGGDRLVAVIEPAVRRVHLLIRSGADGTLRPLAPIVATGATPRHVAWLPVAGDLGDLVVLDDAGALTRYAPGRSVRATWNTPSDVEVVDVAGGSEDTVYAPFMRTVATDRKANEDFGRDVLDAGILVYALTTPEPEPEVTPVEPPRCRLAGDKRASPGTVFLGGALTVALTIEPRCTAQEAARRIVMVVDTSRSMAADDALAEATDQLAGALAHLSGSVEVALVTFDDEHDARLRVPPTRRHAAVAEALAALRPLGDTRLAPGLVLATTLVAADVPTDVVVATDGQFTDDPADAAMDLRAAGGALAFLVYPHFSRPPLDVALLGRYAGGDPGRVVVTPTRARAIEHVGASNAAAGDAMAASMAISDTVPSDMYYVEGSAEPPATWNAATRTLLWHVAPVPGTAIALRYRLVPRTVGRRPTNVQASATLTDTFGTRYRVVLPIPWVEVIDGTSEPGRAFLPFSATRACLRSPSLALALAIDTSSSMAEPAGSGGGTKLDAARAAAADLFERLRPGLDDATLVTFDAAARTVVPLGASPAERAVGLAGLSTSPGTALELGLAEVGRALAPAQFAATRAMILLGDGRTSGRPEDALAAAAELQSRGILRYTIGFGADADRALLAAIASGPHAFVDAPSADGLEASFALLLERIGCAPG